MIELRALGGLRLRDSADGREILSVLARAKPPAVLVYLALSPSDVSHSRDKVLELLWPDSSAKKARRSLSQALHILRGGLGPGVIGTAEGGDLLLEAGAVWCDVGAFDEALASGHEREALELYRGHLWDGSDFSDCPAFERWLDRERQRLRLKAVGAATTLAQELERDGSFVDAAKWLRQARDWAPFDETVIRPLLKLLHGLGERAAAVREYDAYEKRLADVELTPSTEMSELIEKIRPSTARPDLGVLPMPQREYAAPASVTTQPRAPWRTRGRAAAAIVVLGAITAIGATLMRNGRGDAPALDPTRVLVDIYQNETGDPSLDALGRMATDRVTAGLTYTGFVEVVSLGTQLLSREPVVTDPGSTEGSGRLQALARANGTGTVVWGSYYLQGDSLHFLAHVTNAATGEELATLEPVRGPVDDPMAAVEQLRDRMMTTLATLTDPRLTKWMRYASKPPTFEAYTEFVEGIELYGNEKLGEAIPYFLRAEALDADFTMASLWAAWAYGNSRQAGPADSIRQALNRRRAQLAPVDGLFLDYQLARFGRDYDGALKAMRRVLEIAPGSEFLVLAGMAARRDRRLLEAIEFYTQVDPDDGSLGKRISYDLTWIYHRLGDHEREIEALSRLRQVDPESDRTFRAGMRAFAASGRIEDLEGSIPEAVQRDPWFTGFQWFGELRAHGYPAVASDLADRTLEWFEGRPADWRRDPGQSYVYGKLLSVAGRWDESQAILEDVVPKALRDSGGAYVNVALELAYVLAKQGQRDQAYRAIGLTAYSNDLVVRAWVEATLGERERAMELLQENGYKPDWNNHNTSYRMDSMRDYPPYQEFIRPRA